MSHSMMNFTKGIVTGVVVGTVVNMAVRGCVKPSHLFRRNTIKAMKNVGTFVNGLTGMISK